MKELFGIGVAIIVFMVTFFTLFCLLAHFIALLFSSSFTEVWQSTPYCIIIGSSSIVVSICFAGATSKYIEKIK